MTSQAVSAPIDVTSRFSALTCDLSAADWLLLGALASEQKLPRSVLEKLSAGSAAPGRELAASAAIDTFLTRELIVEAGIVHSLVPTRNLSGERAFAIASEFRALVLRELAARELLEAVQRQMKAAFSGTISGFVCALYLGELGKLERSVPELKYKFRNGDEAAFARSLLRQAVCSPFDAEWFVRTWDDSVELIAEQILKDALFTLEPVTPLYAWALSRVEADAKSRANWKLVRSLCDHALLRGELEVLSSLVAHLPTADRLAFSAAASYVSFDLERAQRLLDDSLAFQGKSATPECGSSSVLLALLAIGRDATEGATIAKRFVRARREEASVSGFVSPATVADAGRAVRTLLKYLSEPETERVRLDAHQLRADASAWETVILALTAQLYERSEITRAAWSRRLQAAAERWNLAGYEWFGRQASCLSQALGPEALATPEGRARPGELLLVDLIEPEPEWKKSLDALSAFVNNAERSEGVLSRRVAWFVDMTRGVLSKPALEEFRTGMGWTRGRRVEVAELFEVQNSLPAEDVAVLRCIDTASAHRELVPDALEALCGHPRVFNGARGRLPVEITRGICRVETRHEHGHVVMHVEPAGAVEGVNVVVEDERRLVVYRVSAELSKLNSLLPSGLRVPETHAEQVMPVLARLSEHVEVRSADLHPERVVVADSTPCLRISPEAGAFRVEAGVRPFGARGQFFPAGIGRMTVTAYQGFHLLESERRPAEEIERYRALIERCPTLASAAAQEIEDGTVEGDIVYSFALGEEALLAMLIELRDCELACEIEWQNSKPIGVRGTLSTRSLHGSLRRLKGWYLVAGTVSLDDITDVALAELVNMPFTKSGRFIRLPTGDFVEVEARVRQVLTALASNSQRSRDKAPELKISEAAFLSLRPLAEPGSGFDVESSAREWLEHVDRELSKDRELPATLKATLRPYQIEGYQWLCRASSLGLGVCLADDMGLGKTLQILALLLERAAQGPVLVVAPTSVCTNWMDEIARFAPSLTAAEYVGRDRAKLLSRFGASDEAGSSPAEKAPDVLIVSYALLQQDADELCAIEWNTAVLDEAQFIKNANSLRAKAAFRLQASYRIAMTGTPVENHLGDLWSIFHFLNPTLLGPWKHFQHRYLKPVERDRDSETQTALKTLIKPFILRRRKDEVLRDLPPITTLRHEVQLSQDEALRYALLRRQINDKLRTSWGKREHKLEIFSEITRLRRFCCHPRLVFPEASLECSKIQTFLELAEELRDNGHRALVFSQFVDFLELVREQLDQRGMRYLYLDGSTPKETRHTRVAAFQAGEAELFLISLKAGGFGLNLTAADYVIHLDPWWNPAVEAQATDRAHRIGQERPVTVYRLITKDTIEERIVELHKEKQAIADALLEGSNVASALGFEELSALLA